ncbi:MAG: cupredoxin domain-containing protein [Thermoplasmatota archaeon]
MTRLFALSVLAFLLMAGCSGNDDEDDGDDTPPSSTSTTTQSSSSVATAVEITKAPASAPAGSKATVCWSVSGTGKVPHTAIHWDDTSHASEAPRTFQLYDLGASYPNNQSSAASSGYSVQATGTGFCTAATMPASGSIFVVAHVMDSTGAPGRIGNEREIRVGAASDATIVIQGFAYTPPTLTVAPGATVSVQNKDTTVHTVSSTGSSAFTTNDIQGGATGSFTAPIAPGSYPFNCAYHASMTGTLQVA